MNYKRVMALALSLSAALVAAPVSAQPVTFGLFGDTPYSAWERDHLPDLIA